MLLSCCEKYEALTEGTEVVGLKCTYTEENVPAVAKKAGQKPIIQPTRFGKRLVSPNPL